MSSNEDDDYMSDAILQQCIGDDKKKDVRPGLKRSHALQRQHDLHKKKREQEEADRSKKSSVPLEAEKREQGLNTALDGSNKGFAMLMKMGYKAGQALGKKDSEQQGPSSDAPSRRTEPIPIQIKEGRGGLGRDALLKEIEARKQQARERRLQKLQSESMTPDEFRAHQSRQRRMHLLEADLRKSQKAAEELDSALGWESPIQRWFWPPRLKEPSLEDTDDDSEEEEEEECPLEIPEQLEILTEYLRNEYNYCNWCGTKFTDVDDMKASCPGSTREDHDE